MKGKRHPEKVGRKNNRYLRILAIHYVSTPNADLRLARAIDLLLGSVAEGPKGSINDKEEEPPKDSRPEKIAGQSDGEKG